MNKYESDGIYDMANINISKKWILECYNIILDEAKIKIMNIEILNNIPDFKTDFDIFDENFELGEKLLDENVDKALEHFILCFETYPKNIKNKLVCYNIACCYSKKLETINAFEWLNKSLDLGYTEWVKIIQDKNFKNIIDEFDFIEIVKKMKILSPEKAFDICYVEDDDGEFHQHEIEKYLIKHNIKEPWFEDL